MSTVAASVPGELDTPQSPASVDVESELGFAALNTHMAEFVGEHCWADGLALAAAS